jgi:hypothetical protein
LALRFDKATREWQIATVCRRPHYYSTKLPGGTSTPGRSHHAPPHACARQTCCHRFRDPIRRRGCSGIVRCRLQDDGQSRPARQRAERAAKLAHDERRLRARGAIRSSLQINRDNVKNLRLVWALALGGMQDVGQNGPENEVNPLIDNGFMYTTDGWGTVYKIDARNPDRASSSGSPTRGHAQGNVRARAASRCGKTRDRQPAGRPRDRGQPRQRRDRLGQEVAAKNEFGGGKILDRAAVAEGKVLVHNGAGDAARAAGSRRST